MNMIFDRTMQKFKLGTPPKIKKLMGVIRRTFFSIHRGSPLTNCSFYARDTYRLRSRAGLGIIKIVSATDMKGIMQKRISSIEIKFISFKKGARKSARLHEICRKLPHVKT